MSRAWWGRFPLQCPNEAPKMNSLSDYLEGVVRAPLSQLNSDVFAEFPDSFHANATASDLKDFVDNPQQPLAGFVNSKAFSDILSSLTLCRSDFRETLSSRPLPVISQSVSCCIDRQCLDRARATLGDNFQCTVKLYCIPSGEPFAEETMMQLTSQALKDGDIYRMVRKDMKFGTVNKANLSMWKLKGRKQHHLAMILKREDILDSMDRVIPFTGLWDDLTLGNWAKHLAAHCDSLIVNYWKHIATVWSAIFHGLEHLRDKLDPVTVKLLRYRAPLHSEEDRRYILCGMNSGVLFSKIKGSDERQRLLQNVLGVNAVIPTILTFDENMRYLTIAAKILEKLVVIKKDRQQNSAYQTILGKRPESLFEKLREDWTGGEAAVLEASEGDFCQARTSTPSVYISFVQLLLVPLRGFPFLSNESPLQDVKGTAMPAALDHRTWGYLCRSAKELGFHNERIATGLNHVDYNFAVERPRDIRLQSFSWRGGKPSIKNFWILRESFFLTSIMEGAPAVNGRPTPNWVQRDFVLAFCGSFDVPDRNVAGNKRRRDDTQEEPLRLDKRQRQESLYMQVRRQRREGAQPGVFHFPGTQLQASDNFDPSVQAELPRYQVDMPMLDVVPQSLGFSGDLATHSQRQIQRPEGGLPEPKNSHVPEIVPAIQPPPFENTTSNVPEIVPAIQPPPFENTTSNGTPSSDPMDQSAESSNTKQQTVQPQASAQAYRSSVPEIVSVIDPPVGTEGTWLSKKTISETANQTSEANPSGTNQSTENERADNHPTERQEHIQTQALSSSMPADSSSANQPNNNVQQQEHHIPAQVHRSSVPNVAPATNQASKADSNSANQPNNNIRQQDNHQIQEHQIPAQAHRSSVPDFTLAIEPVDYERTSMFRIPGATGSKLQAEANKPAEDESHIQQKTVPQTAASLLKNTIHGPNQFAESHQPRHQTDSSHSAEKAALVPSSDNERLVPATINSPEARVNTPETLHQATEAIGPIASGERVELAPSVKHDLQDLRGHEPHFSEDENPRKRRAHKIEQHPNGQKQQPVQKPKQMKKKPRRTKKPTQIQVDGVQSTASFSFNPSIPADLPVFGVNRPTPSTSIESSDEDMQTDGDSQEPANQAADEMQFDDDSQEPANQTTDVTQIDGASSDPQQEGPRAVAENLENYRRLREMDSLMEEDESVPDNSSSHVHAAPEMDET